MLVVVLVLVVVEEDEDEEVEVRRRRDNCEGGVASLPRGTIVVVRLRDDEEEEVEEKHFLRGRKEDAIRSGKETCDAATLTRQIIVDGIMLGDEQGNEKRRRFVCEARRVEGESP